MCLICLFFLVALIVLAKQSEIKWSLLRAIRIRNVVHLFFFRRRQRCTLGGPVPPHHVAPPRLPPGRDGPAAPPGLSVCLAGWLSRQPWRTEPPNPPQNNRPTRATSRTWSCTARLGQARRRASMRCCARSLGAVWRRFCVFIVLAIVGMRVLRVRVRIGRAPPQPTNQSNQTNQTNQSNQSNQPINNDNSSRLTTRCLRRRRARRWT